MARYENQYRIYIQDLGALEHTKDRNEQFLAPLNWEQLNDVMTDLTDPEFKLWMYILKWRGARKDGSAAYYDFSPSDLSINFKWDDKSARKYRDNLVEKKYLIMNSDQTFLFYPYPAEVPLRASKIREEQRLKREEKAQARRKK